MVPVVVPVVVPVEVAVEVPVEVAVDVAVVVPPVVVLGTGTVVKDVVLGANSQWTPSYPSRQVHSYPSSSSRQVPPFWHGLLSHSMISV